MRIKGHSIIELTDVNTGKVERFEDNNIVTNAISLFLKDTGMLWDSPLKVNSIKNTPIKSLFGGLLLFDDNITENVDNVVIPAGITMVGNGSAEIVADGQDDVTELGSWNYTESGWMDDGSFSLVWDFATTQANGTIKCACLTSKPMGYVGIGNASSESSRNTRNSLMLVDNCGSPYNLDPVSSSILNRIVNVSMTNSRVIFVDYYNLHYDSQHASDHISATGKLKLITKKAPISKFDIRESYVYNNEGGQNYIPESVTEITLPAAFVTALGNSTPAAGRFGDYYYLIAGDLSLPVGSSLQGVRIHCTTNVVQSFTITNTTQTAFYVSDFGLSFGHDTVAICSNNNRVIFQDIFDNSDTTEVQANVAGTYGNYNADGGCAFIREEGCYAGTNGYKIDIVNRTVTASNIAMPRGRYGRFLSSDNPFLLGYSNYNGGYWGMDWFNLSHTMDYMATINNLQESVVKTPEKTMKVTYILSFND